MFFAMPIERGGPKMEPGKRIRILSLACVVWTGLGMTAASSQILVSIGNSRARTCYLSAKNGFASDDLIKLCSTSLEEENLSPKDRAATYDNRGIMENRLSRLDQALASFDAAIAIDESLGDAHVNRGTVLIRQKKYEDALAEIDKGIGLGVAFMHIGYYNRAVAEELLGRYRDAYYDYMHTLEIEPKFTAASERLKFFRVISPGEMAYGPP
jgi:tetratricopeptide (TPR) repeat protein